MTTDVAIFKNLPLKVWVAWDINKKCWHRPHSRQWKLMPGVWPDKETLQADIQIDSYDAVCIDMSHRVPADITRIADSKVFEADEKHSLAIMKLRQLIIVHVFQNWDVRKQLENKHSHEQLQG